MCALVTVFSLNPSSTSATETTKCYPHEEVYFSCLAGKKVLSICASGNSSPESGYVQYRVGQKNRLELEYPDKPYPPKDKFTISDITGGNLNIRHLKFTNGKFNYVIYQGDVSGIYVKKNGKTISNLTCQDGKYQTISPRALRGIKTVAPIDGID